MPVPVADPFLAGGEVLVAAAAVDPPAAAGGDGPDLLDVHVDELTWAFGHDPAHDPVAVAGDVEVAEPADAELAQPPVHGRGGHLDPIDGELGHDQAGRQLAVPAQHLDPGHHRAVGLGGAAVGPAGPVHQRGVPADPEPADPLADRRPG